MGNVSLKVLEKSLKFLSKKGYEPWTFNRPANNSRSSDCGINANKFVLFDFSPYIIGVRDKSRRGPFSSKELNLCHYFR